MYVGCFFLGGGGGGGHNYQGNAQWILTIIVYFDVSFKVIVRSALVRIFSY